MNENEEKDPQIEAIVRNGWLHARCTDGDGLLRWHILLGRTNASPRKKVGEYVIEIRRADGRYFIRDIGGANRISCVREKLDIGSSFPGIDITFLEDAVHHGRVRGGGVWLSVKEKVPACISTFSAGGSRRSWWWGICVRPCG